MNENTAKECTVCGNYFTMDNFRRTPLSADGYANICKACARKRRIQKKSHIADLKGGNPDLAQFKPRELIEELRFRGYHGELKLTQTIKV